MNGWVFRFALISGAAAVLSGCVAGPNFQPPSPPAVDRYLAAPLAADTTSADGVAQRFVRGRAVEARWWSVFGSAKLDALEDEALRHNADIAVARAALLQAHELVAAQRASMFPNVQVGGNAGRVKNSQFLASPLANNAQTYSLIGTQFSVGYAPDVFGGQRRQVEVLAAQEEVQRFQMHATYLTLTTNVANAAVQIAGLNSQLAAARGAIIANRRILELTRRMQALGEGTTADVAAAETALEQAEQAPPPFEKQIGQLQDLLAVYLGKPVAEASIPTLDLADFQLPAEVPLILPAELMRRRPDVRAAEANLHAATASLGVAAAARLPSFSLTGTVGAIAPGLDRVLSSQNSLWSVGGSVADTVFDAGALRHRQAAAKAGVDQAAAQYRATVLVALQNTADVLQAIGKDAEFLQHTAAAVRAAQRSAELSRSLFAHGQVGAVPPLAAEAALHQAEIGLAQARAVRFADTIGLYQALGGGWTEGEHDR